MHYPREYVIELEEVAEQMLAALDAVTERMPEGIVTKDQAIRTCREAIDAYAQHLNTWSMD